MYVCVCLCVCVSVCLSACVSVCVSVWRLYVSTFLKGSSPNVDGTFYGSLIVGYLLFSARNERACARACVIKHVLIYGPILFKFAVNMLQIPTSNTSYLLFLFTYRANACERARASTRVVNIHLSLDRFSCWAHTTNNHKLHGLHTYHVHAPHMRARARD
jgi:hypothetical protein